MPFQRSARPGGSISKILYKVAGGSERICFQASRVGLCGPASPRGEEIPWAEKVKGKDLSSHPPAWMAGRRKVGEGEKEKGEERLRKWKDIEPCVV